MKSMLFGASLVLLSVSAAGAMDCAKAATDIEKAICNSPDAVTADSDMASAYQSAIKLLPKKDVANLKADQKDWLGLRDNDCAFTSTDDDAARPATPEEMAECVVTQSKARTQYLSGTPAEGPGTGDQMVPVVLVGVDEVFNHTLRFLKPANAGEKAYNAALDKQLKDVRIATKDGDNSDTFDLTLAYASPALISARMGGVYLSAHYMPYDLTLNIDMAKGKRLTMKDALDAAQLTQVQSFCEKQLADFLAPGTEGADGREDWVMTMVGNFNMWSFGATQATLRYVDYDTQDAPLECTIGYDVLKPLLKAGFPLPG
jgi:uncharacterized protein YecT (DUF1311 family)